MAAIAMQVLAASSVMTGGGRYMTAGRPMLAGYSSYDNGRDNSYGNQYNPYGVRDDLTARLGLGRHSPYNEYHDYTHGRPSGSSAYYGHAANPEYRYNNGGYYGGYGRYNNGGSYGGYDRYNNGGYYGGYDRYNNNGGYYGGRMDYRTQYGGRYGGSGRMYSAYNQGYNGRYSQSSAWGSYSPYENGRVSPYYNGRYSQY